MEPTLKDGSMVLVSSTPYWFKNPRINDIVLFQDTKSEKLLIKRIKAIKNSRYLLLGDNTSDSIDSRKLGWIEKKNIVGKVIYIISAKRKDQKSKTS